MLWYLVFCIFLRNIWVDFLLLDIIVFILIFLVCLLIMIRWLLFKVFINEWLGFIEFKIIFEMFCWFKWFKFFNLMLILLFELVKLIE